MCVCVDLHSGAIGLDPSSDGRTEGKVVQEEERGRKHSHRPKIELSDRKGMEWNGTERDTTNE